MTWTTALLIAGGLWVASKFSGPRLAKVAFLKLSGDVPPERAVLVPTGLVESGEVFERPWSTVVTGADLVRLLDSFADSNGLGWTEWRRGVTRPQTTGPQRLPADLDRAMVDVGFLHIGNSSEADPNVAPGMVPLFSGATEQSPFKDIPYYSVDFGHGQVGRDYQQLTAGVHGAELGLHLFPPAAPRMDEMAAWNAVYHCWMFGGPDINRDTNRGLFAPIPAPGVNAIYRTDVAKEYLASTATYMPQHNIIGAGGRPFGIAAPDPKYFWTQYLQMCCKLAAMGFLTRPEGDMTVPLIRARDETNIFGSILGGLKDTMVRYPDVFVGAALGSPALFGKAAVRSAVSTLSWLGEQAKGTGDRVPWMPDWTPVLVDRSAIGINAKDKLKYHTFGDTPEASKLPR